MTKIVLVDKTGNLSNVNVKSINRDILYKKCGFKKTEGFDKKTSWTVKIKEGDEKQEHTVELWARDFGNANTENKYDFPPPCDTALYFGACCLIKVDNDEICDLEVETWKKSMRNYLEVLKILKVRVRVKMNSMKFPMI